MTSSTTAVAYASFTYRPSLEMTYMCTDSVRAESPSACASSGIVPAV